MSKPRPTERQIELLRAGMSEAVEHTSRDAIHPFVVQLEQWGLMGRVAERGQKAARAGERDGRVWTSATTLDGVKAVDSWDAGQ